MNVNGVQKCHWAECIPFIGKRSQINPFPLEIQERPRIDYPNEDTMAVLN